MINEEEQKILDVVGQKWTLTFDSAHGTKSMGICNSHLMLPEIVNSIRSTGGKNIVITDETIFFTYDKKD
jgi:hypothetical protein